ncbi:MAG: PQQ-binding-like beta-propeller repeat protein [Myxococcota bacterium]
MRLVGRILGWGAGLLVVAVFAAYALGPLDFFPGMRLGGEESSPPASWAMVNTEDEIRVATHGMPPWVVRVWYAGTDDGLYVFGWRESTWFGRIEATPEAWVRIGDASYAVRAVPVEARWEHDAAIRAYREKYVRYLDPGVAGQAMADATRELFDDASRARTYQLMRLEPTGETRTSVAASTGWELLGNSPDQQHHSGLSQINTETVSDLGLAWAIDLPTRDGLIGNPLIKNGRIFQSGSQSQVFANDLETGKLLWTYEPLADRPPGSFLETWLRSLNRGLALYEDLVIVGTGDCRLVAIDQATGSKRWEVETCDRTRDYMITGAPRVGGGKVFIGNSCGDMGLNRGHVDAVDARTGEHLWRFYTVPGDPSQPQDSELYEMALQTWGEGWYEKTRGCGSVWDAMVYDPELDQLVVGTGAPAPSDPTKRGAGAGDELFTSAVVALDAATGAYRWHFSQVPGEAWNYEPAVGLMTATLPIEGENRRVVLSVPKNGFVYVLDAKSGEFISGRNYVQVNWAKGLDDETGRPIFDPAARYWEAADGQSTIVTPSSSGAHDWVALAFDPEKNVLYIPAITMPERFERTNSGEYSSDYRYGSRGHPDWQTYAELVAWDPLTQSEVWRQRHALALNGGALHTAGGLVFQGTAEGYLKAYDAASGEQLGSFAAGGAIRAAPSTVMAEGRQYIIVPAGAPSTSSSSSGLTDYSSTKESRSRPRLLAFALGGDAPTPEWATPLTFPKPPVDRYPEEAAAMGGALYEYAGCVACHGYGGQAVGGAAADLRMRLPPNLDYFKAVLGGALAPRMPEVPLDDASTEALYAYLVNTAWSAYEDANSNP